MSTMHKTSVVLFKGMHWANKTEQGTAAFCEEDLPFRNRSRTTRQDTAAPSSRGCKEIRLRLAHGALETVGAVLGSKKHDWSFFGKTGQDMSPWELMPLSVPPRQLALSLAHQASNEEELIHALSIGGMRKTADRIRYLSRVHETDPEEVPIPLDSLRFCTLFVLDHEELPVPQIGLGYDGLLSAEWSAPKFGTIALVFRLDGMVRFAASSLSHKPARRVGGILPPELAVKAVESFIPRLEND